MEIDLHIHTGRYSGCSNIDPVMAITRAKEVGLDGIALTEHGIRWPDEEIHKLLKQANIPGFIVLPGQEIACYSAKGKFQGEFLVFGFHSSLGSNKTAEQLIEIVHNNGGIVIAAHPFKRHDTGQGYYGSGDDTPVFNLDAIEVEHPSYDGEARRRAALTAETMGIAGIGCSDAHDLRDIGKCRSVFENEVRDIKTLCEEVRARRVRAVNLFCASR